jgi:myosin heavy subunit
VRSCYNSKGVEPPPHIFVIADRAFRNMLDTRSDQALIVSGESGARMSSLKGG